MILRREWERFLSALHFLTIWPGEEKEGELLPRGAAYFPLAGVLVGGAAALVGGLFVWLFSPALFPVVAVLSLLIFTRALHAEGLADTLEGLAVRRTPEERLRVMGDRHLGTIGALVLLGLLLIKVTALASTPPKAWAATLLGAVTLSRWTMAYLCHQGPYLEPGERLGPGGQAERWALAVATGTALLVGGLTLGLRGLILVLVLWAGSAAARAYFVRSLGGITRHALGAVGEAGETLVLLTSMG